MAGFLGMGEDGGGLQTYVRVPASWSAHALNTAPPGIASGRAALVLRFLFGWGQEEALTAGVWWWSQTGQRSRSEFGKNRLEACRRQISD